MKPKSNKDLVKLYYEELWNKNKKEYIETLLDDNITFHGSLDINTVGKQEFANYMDKILTGIPNLFHGVELMVCENDYIAVRAIYNGTHKGKLFDFEPTGNRIKYNGASFFKFKEGKIVDIWVLGDLTNLYKQLQ
ncbi:MAG: ester cyclase [Sulfurimonadaceae bacterium]